LLYSETANVFWKRKGRGEISAKEAEQLFSDLLLLPLKICETHRLVAPALTLALRTGRTVYDSLYLALAVEEKCPLVSEDRRLINALQGTPLEKHLLWLGDLPD